MRTRTTFLAALLGTLAGAALAAAATPAAAPDASAPPRITAVTFGIRHRVFTDFAEKHSAKLKETFPVGDTPYSAQVVQFVPDFMMDLKTHRITSRTNQPNNPAFRIIVREKGVPQDTSWAFMNMPPHFGRKSMLAFKVLRIDFEGRAPMVADTSSTPAGHP